MPGSSAVIVPPPLAPERETFRRLPFLAKVAVTVISPSTGKLQVVEVLVHSPVQPTKRELPSASAFRRTMSPASKEELHVAPQASAPSLEIVPSPSPAFSIVTSNFFFTNLAVTVLTPEALTTQVALPEHPPLQPSNVELVSGDALSVTFLPGA